KEYTKHAVPYLDDRRCGCAGRCDDGVRARGLNNEFGYVYGGATRHRRHRRTLLLARAGLGEQSSGLRGYSPVPGGPRVARRNVRAARVSLGRDLDSRHRWTLLLAGTSVVAEPGEVYRNPGVPDRAHRDGRDVRRARAESRATSSSR